MANEPSDDALEGPINELIAAILELLRSKRDFTLPAMMLLYNAIDIFANLARPEGAEEASEEDFKLWVKSYLLPRSGLPCNAEDIYAAKISLARHLSPAVPESRKGKAREVFYEHGDGRKSHELFKRADMSERCVSIPVLKFLEAFVDAASDFEFDWQSDPAKQALLEKRTAAFYSAVPAAEMDRMADRLRLVQGAQRRTASLNEFISLVLHGPVTVFAQRDEDGDLSFMLAAKEPSSNATVTYTHHVGDPVLHGERDFSQIKDALEAAGISFEFVDYRD